MILWKTKIAFLILLPLIGILIWIYVNKKNRTPSLQFSNLNIFKNVQPTLKSRLLFLPQMLKVVSIVLAIVALARPQQANEQTKTNVEGIDIMIVLDISDSMLIEDMKPENRLESAKITIQRFIKGRQSDRIGMIVFAGESFTRVPLTLDYELLLKSTAEISESFTRVPLTLDYELLLKSTAEIEISRNIKMGTAIGVALANAVARIKDSNSKNKVIIFLTDGENNSGTIDPETSIEIAKGYGIKIYSVGIGRDGQTQIPIYTQDPFGNKVKRYQPFTSYVNEDLLSRMAKDTGGKFYRTDKSDSMDEIFSDIDNMEKTKMDINKFVRYSELFQPYLIGSILLYVLSFFLGRTILRRSP